MDTWQDRAFQVPVVPLGYMWQGQYAPRFLCLAFEWPQSIHKTLSIACPSPGSAQSCTHASSSLY